MAMMTATPFASFATEEGSFDALGNDREVTVTVDGSDGIDTAEAKAETKETTDVIVVDSVEELSDESEAAYDNDAFFTIDASKDDSADLATDEVSEDVTDILSGGGSASQKQDEIIESLEDSGLYRAEESGKSKVEVTSKFAYQRLRLAAPQEEEINAYGATKAVYFEDSYLLSYDSMEATMLAYDALAEEYGRDAVLIDSPMKLSAGEKGWGTSFMKMSYHKTLAENNGDVTVAVIDTGIQKTHPVFDGKTILEGKDFVNNDDDPSDDEGHGTAVCGVIAESTPSNVSIMPLKALDEKGEGSLLDILNAVRYADKNGADIINMSLGGYLDYEEDLAYCEELFSSYEALIVCAAGNENRNMDAPGVIEFPGELSSTVCVGSITINKERSSFSNYGQAVDFAAPGSSVLLATLNGSYGAKSGTSFSSPYLTAAAAIVKAGHSDYSNEQIINGLQDISEDLGDPGRDVYFGSGCPRFPDDPDHQRGGSISGHGITTTISDISSRTYNGYEQKQSPCVIVNGELLEQDTDYIIRYRNNVNAGTAEMTIVGTGVFSGEIEGITFIIFPKTITPQISLSGASFSYTGSAICPGVTVRSGGITLTAGTDYTINYSNNVNAGTGYVHVTCKGNYNGSRTAAFEIKAQETAPAASEPAAVEPAIRKITPTVKLSKTSYTWNGKVQTPAVAVYDGAVRIPSSQYTIKYSTGRRNVGLYYIKVILRGNYSGYRTVTYKINPKGTGIYRLTGSRRALTAGWSRQKAKMSAGYITGYQLQVSTDPKFRKNNKIATFRGYKNTVNSMRRLAARKKYYVRVRTYKTVGKKNYYSGWSKVKTVRTR